MNLFATIWGVGLVAVGLSIDFGSVLLVCRRGRKGRRASAVPFVPLVFYGLGLYSLPSAHVAEWRGTIFLVLLITHLLPTCALPVVFKIRDHWRKVRNSNNNTGVVH